MSKDHWYVVPDLGLDDQYNVERWLIPLRQWRYQGYSPLTTYRLFAVNNQELVALRRGNMHNLLHNLRRKVDRVLTEQAPMFLRLNTRSPKDAWQQLAPHLEYNDKDSTEARLLKTQQQLQLLQVSSFQEVSVVLQASQRATEDIDRILQQKDGQIFLVLQAWRPSEGPEYRCFCKDGNMLCACDCDAQEPVSFFTRAQMLSDFCASLAAALPQLPEFVVDVFFETSSARCQFIEINPFSLNTDAMCFTWGQGPLQAIAGYELA